MPFSHPASPWVPPLRKRCLRAIGLSLALLLGLPDNATAQSCGPRIVITFEEGSPEDIFVLRNESPAGWRLSAVTLELGTSAGRLIFDTESGGPGVSVFQPFRGRSGPVALAAASPPADGGRSLSLKFDGFAAGASYHFTIDVDDQVAGGEQTTVSGSEIEGASVAAIFTYSDGSNAEAKARFDNQSKADSGTGGCA